MGKRYTKIINNFSLGMTSETRSKDTRRFAMARHFDVFTYNNKLVPRFGATSKETGDDFTAAATKPFKFFYDTGVTATKYLFGLCKTSNSYALILYYDNDTATWKNPANGISTAGAISAEEEKVFFNFNGYAYMFAGGNRLKRYKLDATTALDENVMTTVGGAALSYTTVCQPVEHPEDGIAYFFTDKTVYSLTTGDAWTIASLNLPTGSYITAACAYEQYIAIAVNYTGFVKSSVFLWDRDTTLTTASYRYDFNNRDIYQIKEINGRLMVVSSDYIKVYVDRFNGAEFETINELVGARTTALATNASLISRENFVTDNKLFFPMDFVVEGDTYNDRLGIWCLDASGKLSLDYKVNSATSYKGIFYLQGNYWVAYNTGSIVRSDITFSTAVTSDYETLLLGDVRETKKLVSVGVETEPLPTAGQVVLKYRLNITDDWTTIFTHTIDASRYHEAINIEATGATLPQFEEIQFKVESTGGAVITGLTYKYEIIENRLT